MESLVYQKTGFDEHNDLVFQVRAFNEKIGQMQTADQKLS